MEDIDMSDRREVRKAQSKKKGCGCGKGKGGK
jgi:hypothetical protein